MMKQNKLKIFITGSDGFVGKHLINYLQNEYNLLTPSKKKLNLNKINLLKRYLDDNQPDIILHLASSTKFKKNIKKEIKESNIRERRDRSFYLEPGSIKPKNIMKIEKSLEKLRNDPRSKMEKRASGGRVGLKSGMRVCKLAKRGKGRAYGKNS